MVATVMSQASATCTQVVASAKQTRSSAKVRPGAAPECRIQGNAPRAGRAPGSRSLIHPRGLTLLLTPPTCVPQAAAFRAPFSGAAVTSRASSFSGAQISAKTVRSSARKLAVAAQAKVRDMEGRWGGRQRNVLGQSTAGEGGARGEREAL